MLAPRSYALLVISSLLALVACSDEGTATADVGGGAPDATASADADAGTGDAGPLVATEFTVVEIASGATAPHQLAVQACAGLHNRALGGSVFVRTETHDDDWLEELGLQPATVVAAADFLDACVTRFPRCVRYSYADQQELLPSVLTAAAALEAVPLDVAAADACGEVALDATVELADRDAPHLATRYVFERFGAQTTGLAMLNPGYDLHADDLSAPPLTRDMPAAMVDLVFARRLFVLFLVNGCEGTGPEAELLDAIVNAGHWPTPLGVYGYNNSWLIGGYLHEAQTRCLDSRNMGAIPTETGNLSFFSTRRAPIQASSELQHSPPEDVTYDPTKTYVAFVVGDGDNVRFMMTTRKEWLRQRLADCGQPDSACAPLTWSVSPHLPHLAPDVLAWYYASAASTGRDHFILPPSGHLYAYPTSLAEAEQERFVTATEQDARLLGVGGVVHWDWFDTWKDAEDHFLPRYAKVDGAIRGIFPVNVPYMFEAFDWWPSGQFFRVLSGADGGAVVVFRPRQWRGVDGEGRGGFDVPFFLTPQQMADELAGYPSGTVTWVYMTSDGGLSLENAFTPLVKLLPDHVQIVSADTAARLALASQE